MKKILTALFLIFISTSLSALTMLNNTIVDPLKTNDRHFKDRILTVINGSHVTIDKFDLVRIKGTDDNLKTVERVGNDYQAFTCYGMATEELLIGHTGTIQVSGVIKGMDTSGYEYNQELYLSSERGKITTEKKKIGIGTVIKVDPTDGWIILDIYTRK